MTAQTILLVVSGLALVVVLVTWIQQQAKTSTTRSSRPSPQPPVAAAATTVPRTSVLRTSITGKIVTQSVVTAICLAVVLVLISLFMRDCHWYQKLGTATSPPATTASSPQWRGGEELALSDKPTTVNWKSGAENVRFDPEPGRRYNLQSGGRSYLSLDGKGHQKIEIVRGQPFKISSTDGRPMEIRIEWKE